MRTVSTLALALGLTLLVLPLIFVPASASGTAWARAVPQRATPGSDVLLVFSTPPTLLLEANVVIHVSCSITAPDGSVSSCGATDELVDAHVTPTDHAYSFPIQAPVAAGNYTVQFTRQALLSIPLDQAAAQTTLNVTSDPLDPAGDAPTGDGAPGPASGLLAGPARLLPASTAGRWLASLLLGTGTIAACIVAARPGGRA